ncbi:hypothetical protein M8C21_033581, partial [Ambrosia artemisiifolia]
MGYIGDTTANDSDPMPMVSSTESRQNTDSSSSVNEGSSVQRSSSQNSPPIEVDKKSERKAENGKTETKSSLPKEIANDLKEAIANEYWDTVSLLLSWHRNAIKEQINDGNTALHIAVGIGLNDVIRSVLSYTAGNLDLTGIINNDGSTLLHIAAIVGNTDAAELLVRKDPNLLHTFDKNKKKPFDKAYENMQLHTIAYLLEAIEKEEKKKKDAEEQEKKKAARVEGKKKKDKGERKDKGASDEDKDKTLESVLGGHGKSKEAAADDRKGKEEPDDDRTGKEGPDDDDDEKQNEEPDVDGKGDEEPDVDGKGQEEPDGDGKGKEAFKVSDHLPHVEIGANVLVNAISAKEYEVALDLVTKNSEYAASNDEVLMAIARTFPSELGYVETLFYPIPAAMVAMRVGASPIRNIEKKKEDYEVAKKVLNLVCDKIKGIKEKGACDYEYFYRGPILEAACQNAYDVVVEILKKWPEAIMCKDENGYDIIQLATIHRSEKVYNLIYDPHFPKSDYRTKKDSSGNNMLHLVGRLAPSNKLKLSTGAALQLQSELQWREEVKKLVFPSFATKENIFKDTPDMVFTKEHENLVKEGEKWIKTVAESCSIAAALITTIVFAAAITVPGGSGQEGVPVFMKEVAFTIFAIADAISLFSSATALLVFISILTARFAEQDFVKRLPRRLIIGLCTLLLSTTAMMVAFGATLFLVFCHDKLWMLAPLCSLAFLPIAIFFILQFPLIIDLFRSTYISKFGKSSKINLNDIPFFFSKGVVRN